MSVPNTTALANLRKQMLSSPARVTRRVMKPESLTRSFQLWRQLEAANASAQSTFASVRAAASPQELRPCMHTIQRLGHQGPVASVMQPGRT